MVTLFVLVFLASIAGVIKPYIPGWKRGYFGALALASFVFIGIFSPKSQTQPTSDNGKATAAQSPDSASSDDQSQPPAKPETKWSYDEQKDEMRGSITKYASVQSDNTVDLDFPYGVVSGTITVRKRPTDGLQVMFSVEKGQVLCNSFSSTHISVKFDDKPIQRFECSGASDGSSETAFIEGKAKFLSELKSAKKTTIEAEFFQKGNQQFTFQTAGLVWK